MVERRKKKNAKELGTSAKRKMENVRGAFFRVEKLRDCGQFKGKKMLLLIQFYKK